MRKAALILLILVFGLGLINGAELELNIDRNYLNIPVTYDEEDKTDIEIYINGKKEFHFNTALADEDAKFWTFLNVSEFKGKTALIKAGREDKAAALKNIFQSDKREYLKNVYQEKHRPQLHFSTKRGWINDPCGLVYYDGEFHLFYQHEPYGFYWGQPHWGHAVSTDLVHWKQLPDALYQHEYGGIYSGSAVVDHNNSSGFKTGENDVMVAFYTTNKKFGDDIAPCQCIAYSNDRGRSWTKYKNNPVIGDRRQELGTYNYRDPKVFWHEDTQKWVMVVYERIGHSIFTSDDLKNWDYQSHIETFWECPELFELPVDGNPDNKKWVMYSVSGDYMIGDFDGEKFTKETGMFNYIRGRFYAAQTFNNVPERDGRRIQVGYVEIPGWGVPPYSGMGFNGLIGFPTELTLRTTANGIRMFNEPVQEIEKLHKKRYKWKNLSAEQANQKLKDIDAGLLHVKCEIENINAIGYSISFDDDVLYYGLKKNLFHYNEDVPEAESYTMKYVPELGSSTLSYEFIVDRTSLEVFVDQGRFTMMLPRKLNPENKGIKFVGGDGMQEISDIKIKNLEVYEMQSIWE